MAGYQDSRRFDAGYRLHVLLHKRLRLPRRLIDAGLRRVIRLCSPDDAAVRRDAASGAASFVPQGSGFATFGTDDLPGLRNAVEVAARAMAEIRTSEVFARKIADNKKTFLITILQDDEARAYPELLAFAVSPAILDAACAYFGAVPRLSSIRLWWSPANDTAVSSQQWHLDPEDDRQLKVFINVGDVDLDQGPLSLLPAEASRQLIDKKSADDLHISDAAVEKAGLTDRVVTLTGPAGSGAFVDVSRCLHYGSRHNRRERVVLMLQFTRFDAPRVPAVSWAGAATALPEPLSRRQKLALAIT